MQENKLINNMHVIWFVREGKHPDMVAILINNKQYTLCKEGFSIDMYSDFITDLAIRENAKIYIDANGIGYGLYENLIKNTELVVEKMDIPIRLKK